jgi:hypothetical protein
MHAGAFASVGFASAVGIAISTRKVVYTGTDTHPASPPPPLLQQAQASVKARNAGMGRLQMKVRAAV